MTDSNREQVSRALQKVGKVGFEAAKNEYLSADPVTLMTKDNQAMGVVLMASAVESGNTELEAQIAEKYNVIGTALGQALQARKIFSMMTGEGSVKFVMNLVDRMNETIRANKGTKLIALSDDVMLSLKEAKTEDEKHNALVKAAQEVAKQTPVSFADKIIAWRYLSMLANPKTHIRNFIGNAGFMPLVMAKDMIAGTAEKVFLKQGERTKKVVPFASKQYREAANAALENDKVREILFGEGKYDEKGIFQNEMSKYAFGHKGFAKVMNWLNNVNSAALEWEDNVFISGYFKRAYAGYLEANKINPGKMTEEQMLNAAQYAASEANKATYHDYSALAARISKFSRDARNEGTLSGKLQSLAVEAVLPFKKTPINVLKRGYEYSPLGLITTIGKAAK